MENALLSYTRKTIFKLACDNTIDHRDYDNKKYNSRLLNALHDNNNTEEAIKKTILELLNESEFIELLEKYKNYDLAVFKHNNYDEYEDELYEIKSNVFYHFINFLGLNEISSLHGDSVDDFKNEFFECFINDQSSQSQSTHS
mgnify:CR=1 FL=1